MALTPTQSQDPTSFAAYAGSDLPGNAPLRVGRLLGLTEDPPRSDVEMAEQIAIGLLPESVDARLLAMSSVQVLHDLVPEATLRRARKAGKALSPDISERLYDMGRVMDAVARIYHGDEADISGFLSRPHPLLGGRTPLAMTQMNSAGAQAVLNRAEAGFAL